MIVVDVNTIAYLWIPGEMTESAEAALVKDPRWVSSILWRSEFRNILAGYLRRGELTEEAVTECLEAAESQLTGHEHIIPSSLVMQKVRESTCSAYDCEYVALAENLRATLVTSDMQIIDQFPAQTISLKEFANKA